MTENPAYELESTGTEKPKNLAYLAVGAMGIVFGDIGTSPLYTLQECFGGPHGLPPEPEQILGVISLIAWSLTLVVTIKYVAILMSADNRGEGGIMALLALTPAVLRNPGPGRVGFVSTIAIIGAALLYGDGVITPAISVLSAVEGLEVLTPALKPSVVPITCAILLILFAFQYRGTGYISRFFGPIMLTWFLVVALLGIYHIVAMPTILRAISPYYAFKFFLEHGPKGIVVLAGVILAVTGGEALYADMGHFGRKPIRWAWMAVAYPALIFSYLGQGAVLMQNPAAYVRPFYSMVEPGIWAYALVVLATVATVIASQGLISGVLSLTHQAITLGYFPRLTVRHTCAEERGRIYLPLVNWTLAGLCILLVLIFGSSGRLAAAFGLAVSGTMGITSVVFYFVMRYRWKWRRSAALTVSGLFVVVDLAFLTANSLKVFEGGYLPLAIGLFMAAIMVNWRVGRSLLADFFRKQTRPLNDLMDALSKGQILRTSGSAVFMTSFDHGVPLVLSRLVQKFGVVPSKVLLLTVISDEDPYVPIAERLKVTTLGQGFFRVVVRFGFTEIPNIPQALLEGVSSGQLDVDPNSILYVLGHETFVERNRGRMGRVSQAIFAFLSRNARNATDYFHIPHEKVVELGAQVDL